MLLADFAGLAIDHARRSPGPRPSAHELQQTVHALDATLQIARALGGETDLKAILELVAKRGRALVSARDADHRAAEGDELELAAGAGELPPDLVGRRVPLANTVASAALRARQPQRLSDQLNRARFQQHGIGHLGLSARHRAGRAARLPRSRLRGARRARSSCDGEFTAEHQRLLAAFAASAATAVATAQSADDERRRQRSPPPRPSAAAGRGSCTTIPCKRSAACA